MAERLSAERSISRVLDALGKREKNAETSSVRRQLLSTSVRLSPALAPELNRIIDECAEKLGVESKIEPYVYPDANSNAGVARPEDGRVYVLFSSTILDAFDLDELKFVVGHELGHHVFGHHDLPVGLLLSGKSQVEPRLALDLFSWSRFAEISADRAGMYCVGELAPVGRALFKLASGLRGTNTELAIDALLDQIDEIEAADIQRGVGEGARAEWFSTHPFSPLRLKAAQIFGSSHHMREGGVADDVLELRTNELMGIMEPGYLEAKTDEARAMRRFLFAAGFLVANVHQGISDRERDALEAFLGEGRVSDKLSVEAFEEDMPSRLEALNAEAPLARRVQVLRDVCVIARADGHVHEDERAMLHEFGSKLGVSAEVLNCTLDSSMELD